MKVFFAPYYQDNPYQDNLMRSLNDLGMNMKIAESGARGFFKTAGINDADVIHFHWLDPFFLHDSRFRSRLSMEYFFYKLKSLRKGKTIVWTVHNLHNHNKKNLDIDQEFVRRFVKFVDKFSVHNEFTKNILIDSFGVPAEKISVIRHANYINAYKQGSTKPNLREKFDLSINDRVFMVLGNILPYKGVLDLIEVFSELDMDNAKLLICGKVKNPDDISLLRSASKGDNSIIISPTYIPDEELSSYLSLADVMIYPYKNIVTSGALLLGMSYKKCSLASNVGSMSEYLHPECLFSNRTEFKSKLLDLNSLAMEEITKIGLDNYRKVEDDDWTYMAKATEKLYHRG